MKNNGIELHDLLNFRSKKDNSIIEVAESNRSDGIGYFSNEKDNSNDQVGLTIIPVTEIVNGTSAGTNM
ncbi:hypothetical protein AYI70_g20 [Smittium culicis]|uniref:Uncharacterized protein n=1 Tax=Smittium culicis TaxID=133412 RepID=A0A1R1YI91_9FUNG|nr:hypothetical protein AYI70_g20 [Smittium culicis]